MTPFKGVGTFFISNLFGFSHPTGKIDPVRLVKILNDYLNFQKEVIQNHQGIILQYEGDCIQGFWHPARLNPNHAQMAFNASKEIISNLKTKIPKHKTWFPSIRISLGTGELAGNYFSALKRFQVLGPARNLAEKLLENRETRHSCVLLTSCSISLLDIEDPDLTETGRIPNGEDRVIVYKYSV